VRVTAIVLVCLLVAPPGLAQTWAQENADPANRGRLAEPAPDSLSGAEFHGLDGRVIAQVVEGPASLALAATKAGSVYALDATGDTVWQADVGDPFRTAPAWTGEHVVTVPRGDTAYAFTASGEEAWTVPTGNDRRTSRGDDIGLVRMASPVPHPGGGVVIADLEGEVQRVTSDGEVRWTYDFGEDLAVEATPVLTPDGDVIVAAFTPNQEDRGFLARIDGDTGTTNCDACWRVDIGSQVVGAPTVTGDVVLVPLRDGEALEARSLSDGSQRWETAFDDSIPASPSLHEGLAIVGDIAGTVRGVEVGGGEIAWEFNPLSDDPNAGEVTSSQCSALTVADSVAVDDSGVAWAPIWKADICSGFPPQDSRESPFYRLDADDGERLSRERYPKANHGPSLHETGVWTGSDEGGVRGYPLGSTIATYTETRPGEVLLVANTNAAGDWSIAWDGEVVREGEGRPPAVTAHELSPGEHELTLQAGGGSAQSTVTVPGETGNDAPASEDTEERTTRPAPSEDEAEGEAEPASENDSDDAGAANPASLGLAVALVALVLTAGVRPRA
jgi:hypothetical protein